ncbi:MAG: hypothetical protein ABRQ25_01625 [Clostridiaceae bacterium]
MESGKPLRIFKIIGLDGEISPLSDDNIKYKFDFMKIGLTYFDESILKEANDKNIYEIKCNKNRKNRDIFVEFEGLNHINNKSGANFKINAEDCLINIAGEEGWYDLEITGFGIDQYITDENDAKLVTRENTKIILRKSNN